MSSANHLKITQKIYSAASMPAIPVLTQPQHHYLSSASQSNLMVLPPQFVKYKRPKANNLKPLPKLGSQQNINISNDKETATPLDSDLDKDNREDTSNAQQS